MINPSARAVVFLPAPLRPAASGFKLVSITSQNNKNWQSQHNGKSEVVVQDYIEDIFDPQL